MLEHPSFMSDFVTLFPSQLTLVSLLLSNSRTSLQSIYQLFMAHCSVDYIFRNAVRQAKGMIERYNSVLAFDLTVEAPSADHRELIGIFHGVSERLELYQRRVSVRVWERVGMSMEQPSGYLQNKSLLDLQLADNVISSLFGTLSKQLSNFSIPLRYVLSGMSEDELLRVKHDWIRIIEKELLVDSFLPDYIDNVRMVVSLMRRCIERPHERFTDTSLRSLFIGWVASINTFFRELLEVQINDRLVGEYELHRSICCLTGQTINLIGLPINEPLEATTHYWFSPTDLVSSQSRNNKPKEPIKKSNFLRIDHQQDWVNLLRVTTCESPDMVKEECERVKRMVVQVETELASMSERAEDYLSYLRLREAELVKLLLGIQQETIDKLADSLWISLIIQPGLRLVVQKDSMFFTLEQQKGCLIDTLDKFVQYFGQSHRISELVHNSLNLKDINQVYCEFLGLVSAKLKSHQNSDKLFSKIRSKIESYLFYSWQIDGGPSAKDMRAKRQMETKTVTLQDLELGAFAGDEDFYMDLAEPWILQLTMATSPKEIIGCFQEMTNRVQYAMKLNKPKVIMAGDSQLSVSYFLIARQRLRNLSSLLNFLQICWYERQNFGQEQYILTVLRSVLQILLESREKARLDPQNSSSI